MEEDFEKTVELVKEAGFTQLFTFIYSRRPGTEAADQPDQTTHRVKSERIHALLDIQEDMIAKLAAPWVGKVFVGLVEDEGRDEGTLQARLDNNMLVEFEAAPELIGRFVPLKITAVKGAMLYGECQDK